MSVQMKRSTIPSIFSVIPAEAGIHRPVARRSTRADGRTHGEVTP